jgi:hypothetical protein
MSELPSVKLLKKCDDGSLFVRAEGIVRVKEITNSSILDNIALLGKNNEDRGVCISLGKETDYFRKKNGQEVAFNAFTYPSKSEYTILVPC